jgi:hypothetical protein
MFSLEQALADWRHRMAAAGLTESQILDELESHLRQELECGSVTQDAFDAAVQRIGRPEALKREFAKTVSTADYFRSALFTLAGIPNHNLVTTMNTSHAEPAWATYLKAGAFLLPALVLATLSAIFIVPKLQQICLDTGLPATTAVLSGT